MSLHYDDVVSHDGDWSLLLLDAILLVPIGMSLMFWPLQTLAACLVAAAVAFGLYIAMHRTHT